jgi:hypothetical protein
MFELYDDGRAVNDEETVEECKIDEEGIMGAAVERLSYETTVAGKTDEAADTDGTAEALVVARFVRGLRGRIAVTGELTGEMLLLSSAILTISWVVVTTGSFPRSRPVAFFFVSADFDSVCFCTGHLVGILTWFFFQGSINSLSPAVIEVLKLSLRTSFLFFPNSFKSSVIG